VTPIAPPPKIAHRLTGRDPLPWRAQNADRRAERRRMLRLLNIAPQSFSLCNGMQDDCMRIAFRPNPAFTPSTYDSASSRLAGILSFDARPTGSAARRIWWTASTWLCVAGHINTGQPLRRHSIPVTRQIGRARNRRDVDESYSSSKHLRELRNDHSAAISSANLRGTGPPHPPEVHELSKAPPAILVLLGDVSPRARPVQPPLSGPPRPGGAPICLRIEVTAPHPQNRTTSRRLIEPVMAEPVATAAGARKRRLPNSGRGPQNA